MNISIFGLGYVGCVGAACLAKLGHKVIGVDVNENKVRLINEGKPTIIEEGIAELCAEAHEKGLMSATMDVREAVHGTDVSFIVVGTPSSKEGHLNLNYIYAVAKQIGEALKDKTSAIGDCKLEIGNLKHIVAIRSTVLPGTNEKVGEIIAQASGLVRGKDFTIVSNPEFLREGTSVKDYFNPPLTLVGTDMPEAEAVFREIYKDIDAEFICTDIRVAEMMKYVNNTYHALKIVFGNEVGNICKELNIDSHKVMEIFCKDKQLNISPYYFKPGFAYGGSCLPKDMKALKTLAHDHYVEVPVIEAIGESNELQKRRAVQLIMAQGKRKVGILGLSFKAGTDDLRCSPIVDVVESLLGKGFEIRIYDKNVKVSELTGTNKDFIMAKIPHLQHFVTDNLDAVCCQSDVLVVTNKEKEFAELLAKYPNKIVVDLVRQWKDVDYAGHYEGLSWGDVNVNREGQEANVTRDYRQTEF
ncbi:MAG: UDP-glucose/GDP-mannose dehydrogenase family protein [Paludibacteraceae bacterium]|nr:UDP-glucose/GDP-mannose dehydrogenase family protein [Paludibacteraceae bacterium]